MMHDSYTIAPAAVPPPVAVDWNGADWQQADILQIRHFHAQSSEHHPQTDARILHDAAGLTLQFRVQDQYVRSVHTRFMESVCKDSCVEFFFAPSAEIGPYFNFEINAGGTLLASYITQWERRPQGGFSAWTPLTAAEAAQVTIATTLPAVVDPERVGPQTWGVTARIPFAILEAHAGPLPIVPGETRWRANLYKCGDHTSHPHWASWQPLGDVLNFHQPQYFGTLLFAKPNAFS